MALLTPVPRLLLPHGVPHKAAWSSFTSQVRRRVVVPAVPGQCSHANCCNHPTVSLPDLSPGAQIGSKCDFMLDIPLPSFHQHHHGAPLFFFFFKELHRVIHPMEIGTGC